VNPRTRAALFGAGALVCAGLSATLAGSASPAPGLGQLRAVVVARAAIDRGTVVGRREAKDLLEARRVPAAFAPPDALGTPAEALGRRLAVPLTPGSYLTAASLTAGAARDRRPTGPPRGTSPVEVAVTGAAALGTTRTGPGALVDVVVSGSPGPGPGAGRTYVAAERVPLLELREARAEAGMPADRWIATLALTRAQALRLIRAEGVARSIRLLAN
jgi:hypothetical protein